MDREEIARLVSEEIKRMEAESKDAATEGDLRADSAIPATPSVPAERVAPPAPTTTSESVPVNGEESEVDADAVISSAFNAALINKIGQSDELKEDLLRSAERVVKNKVGRIDSDAERESKKAYFNNKKDACECFGYTEETTEKWAVNAMNVWHNIMTAIWIVFGCITFAPITFVARKIKAIFKQTWLAVLLAVIIYLLVVLVPIIITYIPK